MAYEVSQPSIDRSGHDVVLEANCVTRHVKLKTSSRIGTIKKAIQMCILDSLADGIKKERPNLRVVPKSKFREIADVPALYAALFGNAPEAVAQGDGNGTAR